MNMSLPNLGNYGFKSYLLQPVGCEYKAAIVKQNRQEFRTDLFVCELRQLLFDIVMSEEDNIGRSIVNAAFLVHKALGLGL